VAREAPTLPALAPTWTALTWLVASSCIGFVLTVWVLGRWTASATSYTAVLMPLVATASGALLAGEAIGIALVLGGLLVLVSVYFGAVSKPVAAAPQPSSKHGRR
jgi:drug/metabolite transporter (DMT)-like permease